MQLYRIKDSFVFIIFGASGDLAKLKIFPALYSLMEQGRFPKKFHIVGFSRTAKTDKEFRKEFTDSIKQKFGKEVDNKILKAIASHVHYFTGQYSRLEDFQNFRKYLKDLTGSTKTTKIAYFSVPPVVFKDIIQNLGETKSSTKEDLRLVIEKPFGVDAESARELFHFIARYFDEECVYLLDHYLGKAAVQSILHLRHSNRLLNIMMKGPSIANIQITASEEVGVDSRIGYFEKVGTIKDMIQSHLLQVLALVAMSIPITENHESLHREKYSILSALNFTSSKNNIVTGQYKSYKKQKDVPNNSTTETFAAIRLFIDRESWYNTPIYMRTGKRLKKKHTYVVIEFKKFEFQEKNEEPNRLVIELQPNEVISIRLLNRHGTQSRHQEVSTSQSIACTGDDCLPEHGLLLLDVIRQNRMHFLSFQEIIATWKITDRIIQFLKRSKLKPETYTDYSDGPKRQNNLTAIDGFTWFDPN